MNRSRLLLSHGLACAVASLGATCATAQQAASAEPAYIEQVLVRGAYFGKRVASGAKTPTPLMDVPQSVSLMSAEQINDQALTSIAQVMQYTPGVSVGQGEDHRDQITIRGQNTTADFFIDGLRDDIQYFRPLYNLERVEVLRGANALLFGRGGGGGVVNRVTKAADISQGFTEMAGGVDTFGAGLLTIDSNLPLTPSQAIRVNGMVESIDNHRDFKDGERWAVNPTYSVGIGDATRVIASWERVEDDRVVDRGNPSLNGQPLAGNRDTFFGSPTLNNMTFNGDIVRLRADHRLTSAWSLNATVQYANYDKHYQNLYPIGFDEAANTVSLDGYRDSTDRENTLAQFNAIGQWMTAGVEHTLLAGAEIGRQETTNSRRDALFAASQNDQITVPFSQPLALPTPDFPEVVRNSASEVTFRSIFIQDEIALNDHWSVVAGIRWDDFEIDVLDGMAMSSAHNGRLRSRDNKLSPRAGIIYKPTATLSVYGSYSVSFLPRSGDQFLTLTPSTASLAPEEFENIEAGVKWRATDRLNLTAAVFEITRDNGTAVDPNNPERSVLTGTETRGVELQVMGTLSHRLSINANYTYLDGAELGRFIDGNSANRALAQLPAHKLTVWGDWTFNSAWRAGMGLVYQDEQYASLSNAVTLPSFSRMDAAVFWDVSDKLSLQLNVENVLDEDYYPAAHNDNNVSVGRPLNARLTARYHL